MSETPNTIGKISSVFTIGYPISILLFFVLGLSTRSRLYWDGYNLCSGVIIFLLVAGFLPFVLSLFLSSLHSGWRILASLFVFPMLCCSAFFWLDVPYYHQVNEVRFLRHKYLIAYHNSMYEDGVYDWYLFECASTGIFCKPTLMYSDKDGEFYNDSSVSEFVVDEDADELHVLIDGDLLYTVGDPSRQYIPMLRGARRGKYTYHLSRHEDVDSDSSIYGLSECDAQFACTRIPFEYAVPNDEAGAGYRFFVEVDAATDEVQVLQRSKGSDPRLIFSYDDEPRCHVESCSVPDD